MAARWTPFAIALLAGLAQAVSMATPWNGEALWWLQLASLAVLAWQLGKAKSWPRAGSLGWTFAVAWLAGTFWWLYVSMHVYGGLPAVLAALAVLGLAVFLGSYYAAAAAAFVVLRGRSLAQQSTLFAGLWLVAELLRGTWFTGLPWGAGGYAHVDGPLASLARWIGVYGIGFVAAWLAAGLPMLGAVGQRRSRTAWAALGAMAVVVAVINIAGGRDESASANRLSVSLLQGNIPQDEKFQPGSGIPIALDWYSKQLRASPASLTVAPETAVPVLPQQLPDGYLAAIGERFTRGNQAALVGIPLGSFREGYTNSVIGLKPGADVYRYDKHHLVPFGEFIPPLFRWFTAMMNIPLGDFNRGPVGQPSFEWQGQQLAPNICYEDLFGEELGARFAEPALSPTIFVNLSNIGWFGDTVAVDQHLQISRMRAIEFERPVIRATNTGSTAIIDHRGRVLMALPRYTRGVLRGEVEGRSGTTPYAWWISRLGLWPLWLASALIVGWTALTRPSRRRRP